MLTPKRMIEIQEALREAHQRHGAFPSSLERGSMLVAEEAGEIMKAAVDATRHTYPSLSQLQDIKKECLHTIVNCLQYIEKVEVYVGKQS